MYLLSLVSAIYVKQNKSPLKKSFSSSHCVLKGKDDRGILLNNQIPLVESVHESVKVTENLMGNEICSSHEKNVGNNLSCKYNQNVWSSRTTNSIMNEKLSQRRVHGWGKVNSTRNITSSEGPGHIWDKVDSTRNGWSLRTVKKSVGWC